MLRKGVTDNKDFQNDSNDTNRCERNDIDESNDDSSKKLFQTEEEVIFIDGVAKHGDRSVPDCTKTKRNLETNDYGFKQKRCDISCDNRVCFHMKQKTCMLLCDISFYKKRNVQYQMLTVLLKFYTWYYV